jgi:hypothetical protein
MRLAFARDDRDDGDGVAQTEDNARATRPVGAMAPVANMQVKG